VRFSGVTRANRRRCRDQMKVIGTRRPHKATVARPFWSGDHPLLRTKRYDAGCGATAPDAHGTGMTGAIASHRNLLGGRPMDRQFIAYFRVSTDRQGRSGLELEAQRAAVLHHWRAWAANCEASLLKSRAASGMTAAAC
jgi:hypothetical protein